MPIDGYPSPWNDEQHVNYLTIAPQFAPQAWVNELWYSDADGWQHNNLNQLAGVENVVAAASSPLDGYVTPWNNEQHVNYLDTSGHVHELWYSDSGGWQHNDLTQLG